MKIGSCFRIGPQLLVTSLAGALMAYLTLTPLVMLLYGSLKSGPPGVPSDLTVKNYFVLFENWRLVGAFINSLIFSFGSSLLAFAGALYLAWMTERTNVPWKSAVYASILIPMIVPGLLTTIGWIMLFGRRGGLINIIATGYLVLTSPSRSTTWWE